MDDKIEDVISRKCFVPLNEIIANGEMQYRIITEEGSNRPDIAWYIADLDEPAIVLFGCIEKNTSHRWPSKKTIKKKSPEYLDKINELREKRDHFLTEDGKQVFEGALVRYLSGLPEFDYERNRIKEASKLKIRPVILDKTVAEARKKFHALARKSAWEMPSAVQGQLQLPGLEYHR